MSRTNGDKHPRGVFEPRFTTSGGHAILLAVDSEGACVARAVIKDPGRRKEAVSAFRGLLAALDQKGSREHLEVVQGDLS